MTFRNIRAGDRVRFRIPARIGRRGVIYVERSAKVDPQFIGEYVISVDYGRSSVLVDVTNYVSHKPGKARRAETKETR